MIYASVCDGIGAVHQAWHSPPVGFRCAWTSEIEARPAAVVENRWQLPNLGDMTAPDLTERARAHGSIDLLVGGTPCQSFSVAGLRAGLADPRGNLALVFLGIADRTRPRWVVWENVPGVLSSGKGRDFGAFVGGLVQLGYGVVWRVLDAQYVRVDSHARAVPQRRRRVFVVGYSGDWRRAASVLLERGCLCGDPPPSREAGAGVTQAFTRSLGTGGADSNRAEAGFIQAVANPLTARMHKGVNSTLLRALRRLTPRECERLQGFPDDYTLVPFRNKPMSDSARYSMLGNSMAVNVMRWIGLRLAGAEVRCE